MCYKVEQALLQSGTDFLFCKEGQVVLQSGAIITKLERTNYLVTNKLSKRIPEKLIYHDLQPLYQINSKY